MPGAQWSKEEIRVVTENYKLRPLKEWAHLIPGRSAKAIYHIAQRFTANGDSLADSRKERRRHDVPIWKAVHDTLSHGCMSANRVAALTGFSERTIRKYLRENIGVTVYVKDWLLRRDTGKPDEALFALGNKANMRKPKPLKQAEVHRRYRKRLKQERPDVAAARFKREQMQKIEKQGRLIRMDPAASWMTNTIGG